MNAERNLSENVSSDARLASGACEADWSGGRALTGQGRGSLRAAGASIYGLGPKFIH